MKQLKNFSADSATGKAEVDGILSKYSDMSEDDLIDQLIRNVRAARASGTYDSGQMAHFIDIMSPHLSAEQRAKLTNLIGIINSEDVQ